MGDDVDHGLKRFFKLHWRGVVAWTTMIAFLPMCWLPPMKPFRCVATICVCVIFWMTECCPKYITAYIPVISYPLMGVIGSKPLAAYLFTNNVAVTFAAGIICLSLVHSQVHKKLANPLISLGGFNISRILIVIMIISGFLSMLLPNVVAASLMCVIVQGVLEDFDRYGIVKTVDEDAKDDLTARPFPTNVTMAYYLGISYATTFGGNAVLTGSTATLTMEGLYHNRVPDSDSLTFWNFMGYSFFISWIQIALSCIWLQVFFFGLFRKNSDAAKVYQASKENKDAASNAQQDDKYELKQYSCRQIQTFSLAILMILLLIMRTPGPMNGWKYLIQTYFGVTAKSASAAIIVLVLLFALPPSYGFFKYCVRRKPVEEDPNTLLPWRFAHVNFRWGVLLLMSGDVVLSEGVGHSGLNASFVGPTLRAMEGWTAFGVQAVLVFFSALFGSFIHTPHIINYAGNHLITMAPDFGLHPLYLIMPMSMAANYGFLLPVGNFAHAVCCCWGHIRIPYILLTGLGAMLIGVICQTLGAVLLGPLVISDFSNAPMAAAIPAGTTPSPFKDY